MFPSAMGAVVDCGPTTFQTPLSGHFSPVLAVVPIGDLDIFLPFLWVKLQKFMSVLIYKLHSKNTINNLTLNYDDCNVVII